MLGARSQELEAQTSFRWSCFRSGSTDGRKREGAKGIFGRTKPECAGTVSLNHPLAANLRKQENYA
jgi:hypothetical protein